MAVRNLKGRNIADVPYTSLVEALCRIRLSSAIAGVDPGQFSKEDLLSLLMGIYETAGEALICTQATDGEKQEVDNYLKSGMRIARTPRQ